jgi:hypothetical protein
MSLYFPIPLHYKPESWKLNSNKMRKLQKKMLIVVKGKAKCSSFVLFFAEGKPDMGHSSAPDSFLHQNQL